MVVQVDIKVKAGRFSDFFGTKLYPCMYSPSVHAVPKLESDMLHLMVDHLSGEFSPNNMIACEDIVGITLMVFAHLGLPSSNIMLHSTG